MSNESKCPICGEPTSVWYGNARKDGLCRYHAQQLKEGLIEQCPDCGTWKEKTKPCDCQKKEQQMENPTIDTNELTCLLCKKPSNGKHFCIDCWKEYKDKKITVVIDKCLNTEIIDKYGNKKVRCESGVYVRSGSEARIADKLFSRGIRVVYEQSVSYVDEKTGETKVLHPDFYLPDEKLYIEYNGYTGKEYEKMKNFSEKIYAAKGLRVLVMSNNDTDNLEEFFAKHLKNW